MPSVDPIKLARHRLRGLTDAALEQLVFQLVREEYPDAHTVRGTDGGMDVFSDYGTPPARGWQAKNFEMKVDWEQCRSSLKSAMENYSPPHYTFVFPFQLSKNQRDFWADDFMPTELAKYDDLVTLDYIDDLDERLQEHPKLIDELTDGELGKYVKPIVDRTTATGINPVGSIQEVMTRSLGAAEAIADAEARDPGYDYFLVNRSVKEGDVEIDESGVRFFMHRPSGGFPTFNVTLRNGYRVVEVTSATSDGAAASRLEVVFDDSDEGEALLAEARASLCRGVPFVRRGGDFGIKVDQVPEIFKDQLDETNTLRDGEISLGLSPPLDLKITLTVDGEENQATLNLYRIPELNSASMAYGGNFYGARFALDFYPKDDNPDLDDGSGHEMFFGLQLALDVGGIRPFLALRGLGLLQQFGVATRAVFVCDGLLPEGGLEFPPPEVRHGTELMFSEVVMVAIALQIIENNTGQEIAMPAAVTAADVLAAQLIVEIAWGRTIEVPITKPGQFIVAASIGSDLKPADLLDIEVNLPPVAGIDPQMKARQVFDGVEAIEIVDRESAAPKISVNPTSESSQLRIHPLSGET